MTNKKKARGTIKSGICFSSSFSSFTLPQTSQQITLIDNTTNTSISSSSSSSTEDKERRHSTGSENSMKKSFVETIKKIALSSTTPSMPNTQQNNMINDIIGLLCDSNESDKQQSEHETEEEERTSLNDSLPEIPNIMINSITDIKEPEPEKENEQNEDLPEITAEDPKNLHYVSIIHTYIRNTKRLQTLLENIQTISNIKSGEKLWLSDQKLAIDNSIIPQISRWAYSQNRYDIITFIHREIQIANNIMYLRTNEGLTFLVIGELSCYMGGIYKGLCNLKITYSEDKNMINKIDDIIACLNTEQIIDI